MGVIEPMVIASAMSSGMLSFAAPALWGLLLSTLAVAAVGIALAVPRPHRVSFGLRLARPATAH